jgi:Icc-related predicted phosphoesterase
LGLGGTPGHKKKGWEFSQNQMARRIKRLWLKLWKSKGFDVLVTHAPAKGHHDGKGIHEGYAAFGELIRKYHPSYFFHGHMHMNYDAKQPRLSQLEQQTAVVNAWNKYVMDIIIPERAD